MDAPVTVKPVMKPSVNLKAIVGDDENTLSPTVKAPTMTAKPIIAQLRGRIILEKAEAFFMLSSYTTILKEI